MYLLNSFQFYLVMGKTGLPKVRKEGFFFRKRGKRNCSNEFGSPKIINILRKCQMKICKLGKIFISYFKEDIQETFQCISMLSIGLATSPLCVCVCKWFYVKWKVASDWALYSELTILKVQMGKMLDEQLIYFGEMFATSFFKERRWLGSSSPLFATSTPLFEEDTSNRIVQIRKLFTYHFSQPYL